MGGGAVIEKVTAFVTRDARTAPGGREVLVFRHSNPRAGIQLPAGSVEPGEAIEAAVLREVAEETGLTDVVITGEPERAGLELDDDQVYLVEHPSRWRARGIEVGSPVTRVVAADGDHIQLEARDRDGKPVPLRVTLDAFTRDVRRWLFHLELRGAAPERFERAFDTPEPWSFYWVDLDFGPRLRDRHREWFAQMRPRLWVG